MTALFVLFQLFSPVDPAPLARFHELRIERLRSTHGADSKEVRGAEKDLGLFWLRLEKSAEAEAHLRSALPDAEAIPFLAEAVAAQGREQEAEALFESCRENIRCLTRLAQLAERRGDAAGHIRLLRETVRREPNGTRRNDLAQALEAAGELKEAEAIFRLAAREQESQLGPGHPETATTWNNLASLLSSSGRFPEAEALQRKAYLTMQRTLGPRHVRTGLSASNLAEIVRARGREEEAEKLFRQALEIFEQALPAGHPWIRDTREALAAKSR